MRSLLICHYTLRFSHPLDSLLHPETLLPIHFYTNRSLRTPWAMELRTFLSTNINNLYSQKKKFLVSDAVSDYIRSPFDLTKKFIGSDAVSDATHKLSDLSDAVSDATHKLSDLTDTFLASDTVVHVLQWFKKENVLTMVAVVVIVLLSCQDCW